MFNIKFISFALVVLSSVGFFHPKGAFSGQIGKLAFYLASLLAIFVALMMGRKLKQIRYPRNTFWTLMASMVFSALVCSSFQTQSLSISLSVILGFLFAYFFFWTMLKLDIPEKQILRFILVCCLLSVPIYFINVATFPNYLFGEVKERVGDMTRGMLRVPVYFLDFMAMFIFYAINRCSIKFDIRWALIAGLFLFMVFMSVTRQNILITYLLAFVFLWTKISWFKRAILVLAIASSISIVTQIPVVKTMIELTEDQEENNDVHDEDIRIYDYKYFGDEFQTNAITRVFGNGMPSLGVSPWGSILESEWNKSGTYLVDVGWVGFYWIFGAIATIALLMLFIKGIMIPKPPEKKYLNYTIIYVMLLSVASGPLLYNNQIIFISVILYLAFSSNSSNEQNRDNHPKLQRRLRLSDLHRQC